MKKFHVLYREKEEDLMARSVVIEAENEIAALQSFHEKYFNRVFLALFTFELAESMYKSLH